ncbi:MAG TPA: transcriptional regulator [Anaerolineales bacterium]|nr:transcriptional regulator [Anaerolineales bacterium]
MSVNFAPLSGIDRLVHEPARFQVLALLYVIESADFTFIMSQLGLTWGNLSAHITKLEQGGYVVVEKGFKGKRPQTMLSLTGDGRQAFQAYRETMKQMLDEIPE